MDGHTIYVGCLDHVSSSWFIARLLNSRWHDSSTVSGTIFQVSGKIVQQSLARLFNNHWYDYSTVAGTIMQEPLHDCSTVTSRIVQQWLTQLFNSRWHDCSAVTSKIFSFFLLAEFFNSDVHSGRIAPCTSNTTHDLHGIYELPHELSND